MARDNIIRMGAVLPSPWSAVIVYNHHRAMYLDQILNLAGVWVDGEIVANRQYDQTGLGLFIAFVTEHKAQIENYFGKSVRADLQSKPMRQLNFFLGFIGLKLTGDKGTRKNGTKIYRYTIDTNLLNKILEITKRRHDIESGWDFLEPNVLVSSFTDPQHLVLDEGITEEFI